MANPSTSPSTPAPGARWLGGACVAAVAAAWYWLFFLPPRLLGAADPDRYYQFALARLYARGHLPRTLPQVEDLGWGSYFPDKEFLFHALTGSAWALGGESAVLWLVPLLGTATLLCLYAEVSRRLHPLPSSAIAIVGVVGTAGLLFRLSLLRPHLLAIFVFCLLLLALLRERPRLAGLAAAAFALAYHAFIVVGIVAAAAWLWRRQPGMARHAWAWCLGGLALGLIVNPYFPSNVAMGLLHLRLALGLESVPPPTPGTELFPPTAWQALQSYGFLPCTLVFVALAGWLRKPAPSPERTGLLFLYTVTAIFTILGFRSFRAMEYAAPCGLLLLGYALCVLPVRHALPLLLTALLLCQGPLDLRFYRASWQEPDRTPLPAYARLLDAIPRRSHAKVFNCEWEAGSYILYERPDLRFVDLLEPTFLWQASRLRYEARKGLVAGAFADPRTILRGAFHADYVLCAAGPLSSQMQSKPEDFVAAPGTRDDPLRLFAVRPD